MMQASGLVLLRVGVGVLENVPDLFGTFGQDGFYQSFGFPSQAPLVLLHLVVIILLLR